MRQEGDAEERGCGWEDEDTRLSMKSNYVDEMVRTEGSGRECDGKRVEMRCCEGEAGIMKMRG